MLLVNTFYLYRRSEVLSSEEIDIKTFRHEIAAELVGPQFPNPEHQTLTDFDYLAKLPPTEKKTNPTKPCRVCTKNKVQKKSRYFCEKCKIILF